MDNTYRIRERRGGEKGERGTSGKEERERGYRKRER